MFQIFSVEIYRLQNSQEFIENSKGLTLNLLVEALFAMLLLLVGIRFQTAFTINSPTLMAFKRQLKTHPFPQAFSNS